MNLIFRLFLTFNSTSLILVVYLVKKEKVLNGLYPLLDNMPHFVSYIIYFTIPVLLTFFSLLISKWLEDDNIEPQAGKSAIKEVELFLLSFFLLFYAV